MTTPHVATHFESLEKQAEAAKLGMWVFLASEVLLFAGLFALYAASRALHPAVFAQGVDHNPRILGSTNTAILICSSYVVASAVIAVRRGANHVAVVLLALAILMGAGFLVIKGIEYREHFQDGVFPGGNGHFFLEHPEGGYAIFYTLYFLMTGLHAIHVIVGMSVLAWLCVRLVRGTVSREYEHPMALGAMYWHLVDIIWIFLWPMFYLMHGR